MTTSFRDPGRLLQDRQCSTSLRPMSKNSKRCLLFLVLWSGWPASAGRALAEVGTETCDDKRASVSTAEVLAGVRTFFARSACDDGSFRPGIDPAYPGMADSAYSDLAPVTYAVILHKTFGWN